MIELHLIDDEEMKENYKKCGNILRQLGRILIQSSVPNENAREISVNNMKIMAKRGKKHKL
jgi:hypothetical protein